MMSRSRNVLIDTHFCYLLVTSKRTQAFQAIESFNLRLLPSSQLDNSLQFRQLSSTRKLIGTSAQLEATTSSFLTEYYPRNRSSKNHQHESLTHLLQLPRSSHFSSSNKRSSLIYPSHRLRLLNSISPLRYSNRSLKYHKVNLKRSCLTSTNRILSIRRYQLQVLWLHGSSRWYSSTNFKHAML